MISLNIAAHTAFAKKQAYAIILKDGGEYAALADQLDQQLGGALRRGQRHLKHEGKKGEVLHIAGPGTLSKTRKDQPAVEIERVFLAFTDKKMKPLDWQNIGGSLAKAANQQGAKELIILCEATGDKPDLSPYLAAGLGAILGSYHFHNYFTKLKPAEKPTLKKVTLAFDDADHAKQAKKEFVTYQALADAVYFTRDIVSEPGNVIYPESLAARCKELTKHGLEVQVLDEAKMRKLGMGALLGVAQGSVREAQMVVMSWKGGKKADAPLALVGKGVTFDSGGISLKPGAGMEDMKWDMGGSAAVIGTMIALATRKTKQNVVGIVGLVENMPDGKAQRPGDVVTSMSGQTIEVINTDAEGRLVLADCLHYAQTTYKPRQIIDLATLTGAMVVALGHEYAGVFSNNDKLAKALMKAGEQTGEKLWRMPMGPAYDKQIRSDIADMKNVGGGRGAGSITAAQFLERFIQDVPWAHLDIAGKAWANQASPTVPKGATAYGVQLLTAYIEQLQDE